MKAPWMKFYPTDWRSDPRLRMCSLEARGLWIEMVCLMHEAEPYGHLRIAGEIPTLSQLSSMVGAHHKTVDKAIIELLKHGVFDRDSDGCIVSRRMVRDREKANKDRANGKKGGNPGLTPTPAPKDKVQSPESRVQKERKKDGADAPDLLPGFMEPSQEAPDARVYRRGREVLGKNEGWLIKRLIEAKGGNFSLAVAAIEQASTKDNPKQYLLGVIKPKHRAMMNEGTDPLWRDNL